MALQDEFNEIAYQFLLAVKSQADTVTSEKADVRKSSYGAIMESALHLHFAKYGRPKGKSPPIDILTDWVVKKGMASNTDEATMIAYAIGKSISKKGTKNYIPSDEDFLTKLVKANSDEFFRDIQNVVEIQVIGLFNADNIFPNKIII